ncbi:MAG TPA: putative quinol monooxygenase [Geobacteraceae bacterium]
MATLTVVAKVVAKGNCIEDVKAELLKLVPPTRREEGCLEYRLHQDTEDPGVFIFYENWESPASLERHMNTLHFRDFVAAVDGMLAEMAVHKMTAIE